MYTSLELANYSKKKKKKKKKIESHFVPKSIRT